jgi:hypothetical protein
MRQRARPAVGHEQVADVQMRVQLCDAGQDVNPPRRCHDVQQHPGLRIEAA